MERVQSRNTNRTTVPPKCDRRKDCVFPAEDCFIDITVLKRAHRENGPLKKVPLCRAKASRECRYKETGTKCGTVNQCVIT